MLARIKISLGSALVKIMHHKEAYVKYREALEIREIPKILIARAHQGLGICCRYLKNWSNAQNHFRLAAELFSETDCDRYMQVQHALGVLWLDVFNFDQANEYFTKARDYYRRKKMALSEVELYEEYARAEFYKQHYEESNECCNRGLQLLDGLNAPLAGRFYLWRYRNYNAMHDKTREEEIWLVVKSLLGSQLKMVIDTLDPNMPPETRQALYAKMGYQYPLAQVHL
ncbi:hypothetical protein ACOALA_20575 (plasmid) [Alicyclobacillus acidoterrestris]|uniref:hypothetical protein n=1 Tax=Alicyclobacillus acidoterrestris TaxID=1450 RepID=UPI003F52BC58